MDWTGSTLPCKTWPDVEEDICSPSKRKLLMELYFWILNLMTAENDAAKFARDRGISSVIQGDFYSKGLRISALFF